MNQDVLLPSSLNLPFVEDLYAQFHRDPASVVASMATMIRYTSRMHLDPVDPVAIGR